jgi:hypothetical protein
VCSVSGVYFYITLERIKLLGQNIQLVEKQIQEIIERVPSEGELLARKNSVLEELNREKGRYYTREEIDPYQYSVIIKKLLTSDGMNIKRYQTVEVKDITYLEYSVDGDALGFVEFLKNVSSSDKHWNIPYLSIDVRKGEGNFDSLFRITYETIGE